MGANGDVPPQHLLEPEPEPEQLALAEEEVAHTGGVKGARESSGGEGERGVGINVMEHPAIIGPAKRRSGLAPGSDAYLAAGRLALPVQPLDQADSDATAGTRGLAMKSRMQEDTEQMRPSQHYTVQPTQLWPVPHQEHSAHQQPSTLREPDDTHYALGSKKAIFRAVVQDDAGLVSTLIAQQPELLT